MTQQELLKLHGETVRQTIHVLFGTLPSPRVLAELTGEAEKVWVDDYPYAGGPPQEAMPRRLSLAAGLKKLKKAVEVFSIVEARKGTFFECLELAARGREFDAVSCLFHLADGLKKNASLETINSVTLLLLRSLMGLDMRHRPPKEVAAYLDLCFHLFPLMTACGCAIPSPALIFYKARGLAHVIGNLRLAAFFELMIGATNMCNHSGHGNLRSHAMMRRGRKTLLTSGDHCDRLDAAPYLGIWHFLEGEYWDAMREFQIASPKMQAEGQIVMELFCLRHWCFSAFNLGMFDYSEQHLESNLRRYSPRSSSQLARTLRGQLAACCLRMGKLEAALDHLSTAQFGISSSTDIVSYISNLRHLAYYHVINGYIENGYQIFRSGMEIAIAQHYERPVYFSCVVLELLYVFCKNKMPPVPGYDLEYEIERCIHGPSRLLRGIALRICGQRCMDGKLYDEAQTFLEKSLAILKGVSVQEQNKSHLKMAALLLLCGQREKAALHVLAAWPQRDSLHSFWTKELESLLPSWLLTKEEPGLSRIGLLNLYRENLAAIPSSKDKTTFAISLLMSSCHMIGATYGFLFLTDRDNEPRLLASVGPDGPYPPEQLSMSFMDFVRLVQDGTPQIFDKVFNPLKPDEEARMIIGFSMEGDQQNYILIHDKLENRRIRELIDTDLLIGLGEIVGKALNKHFRHLPVSAPSTDRLFFSEHTEIISSSPLMIDVLKKVDAIADTDASVLICGESGSGKDLIARRLHERSGCSGSMVSLNMAGLPGELLASELFGHERGAFTGAQAAKPGLVEMARNGTLFLDEITESSPSVQAALLRVLESKEFYRIGGTQPVSANFRLVTASNRSLQEAMAEGYFRRDLYYRIAGVVLQVPPLRERPEDITALAFYYLHYFAKRHNRACAVKFSSENMKKLLSHTWPGNVRELKNVVEQSVLFSSGQKIELELVPMLGPYSPREEHTEEKLCQSTSLFSFLGEFPSLEEMEKRYIRMVMNMTGGRISGPAGALGILRMNRSTLYARLKELGMR